MKRRKRPFRCCRLHSQTCSLHCAMSQPSLQPPAACLVCFTRLDAASSVVLRACEHRCCCTCLRRYLAVKINEGVVAPPCFNLEPNTATRCRAAVAHDEITALVDDSALLAKYERFRFNAAHPVLGRQCPYCDHSQICDDGASRPERDCVKCGRRFCFRHGNAHAGRSCAEYEARQLVHERKNTETLKRVTKPCPGCRAPVEKNGGCNHMICLLCGFSFCWLCLEEIEQTGTPRHYEDWRFGGCSGLQHVDVERMSLASRIATSTMRVVTASLVAVPALTITVALTVLTQGWYSLTRYYGMTFRGAFVLCFEVSANGIVAITRAVTEALRRRASRTWSRVMH